MWHFFGLEHNQTECHSVLVCAKLWQTVLFECVHTFVLLNFVSIVRERIANYHVVSISCGQTFAEEVAE